MCDTQRRWQNEDDTPYRGFLALVWPMGTFAIAPAHNIASELDITETYVGVVVQVVYPFLNEQPMLQPGDNIIQIGNANVRKLDANSQLLQQA